MNTVSETQHDAVEHAVSAAAGVAKAAFESRTPSKSVAVAATAVGVVTGVITAHVGRDNISRAVSGAMVEEAWRCVHSPTFGGFDVDCEAIGIATVAAIVGAGESMKTTHNDTAIVCAASKHAMRKTEKVVAIDDDSTASYFDSFPVHKGVDNASLTAANALVAACAVDASIIDAAIAFQEDGDIAKRLEFAAIGIAARTMAAGNTKRPAKEVAELVGTVALTTNTAVDMNADAAEIWGYDLLKSKRAA